MEQDIRKEIFEEVQRTMLGPMGGEQEQLENNPLDFYTVGVLFPEVARVTEYTDDTPDVWDSSQSGGQGNGEDDPDGDQEATGQEVELYGTRARNRSTKESVSGEEDSLELSTRFRPSAAGLSVLVKKGSSLQVSVSFATYHAITVERQTGGAGSESRQIRVFSRQPFQTVFDYAENRPLSDGEFPYERRGRMETLTLSAECVLSIVTRAYPHDENLEIKTFTLINSNRAASFKDQKRAADCIFQPGISLSCETGFSAFEDLSSLRNMGEEDINLKLLYRHYKTYGLGHGISVDWSRGKPIVHTVETRVMPVEKVNGVDMNPPAYHGSEVLFMKKLGGKSLQGDYDWATLRSGLEAFCDTYGSWISLQLESVRDEQPPLKPGLLKKAASNLEKCRELLARMKEGVTLLESNPDALKAFEDANRAMFMQRVMADFSRHRRSEKRVQHTNDAFDDQLPDYAAIPYDAGSSELWHQGRLEPGRASGKGNLARWRPFQLAFLLSQVKGIIDPASADRDTVDLIWFPTGGGKTEAYLGLTAFTIFHRRLRAKSLHANPDDGAGVSVLMRYTLRLLNKQQFERAGILICACELIRRNQPADYGRTRISNGIWMGSSMTPNKISDQKENYLDYIRSVDNGRAVNPWVISPPVLSCPCCGNRLVREPGSGRTVSGRWGYFQRMNIRRKPEGRFHIACTNTRCEFHATAANLPERELYTLPIYEVDELIYAERPSLLFSTVDKYVQLAWNSDCFSLFNLDFSSGGIVRTNPAPSLIIQDELHLISAALGTIYGVYEIAIERLCRESRGLLPKIIGASATVRNAREQCARLYARSHFMQFPPPGVDADDSFFAKKISGEDSGSRMYVGFMAAGTTTSTALIRLSSVLLERIPALPAENAALDNYYTLVVYFNALKELGKFRTFLTDDIVAYRKFLANHFGTFVKRFNNDELCELSSVMTADEITGGLDRLEKTTLPPLGPENAGLLAPLLAGGIRSLGEAESAMHSLFSRLLNPEAFAQLGLTFTGDQNPDKKTLMDFIRRVFPKENQPVHVAPATNMISVGVDVPRLNTMIINGQPKTAAEYIQASSRVGREKPGVVFSFLSPTKNRDRSHYERFKSFHQAYYYHVESSSVTPFSGPALEKVLPTVLIALTRGIFLQGRGGVFPARGAEYRAFISGLLDEVSARAEKIHPESAQREIRPVIEKIERDYFDRITALDGERTLADNRHFLAFDPLNGRMQPTFEFHQQVLNAPSQFTQEQLPEHLSTLQTLRNVESSSLIIIKN